jgi:hypothetical protein
MSMTTATPRFWARMRATDWASWSMETRCNTITSASGGMLTLTTRPVRLSMSAPMPSRLLGAMTRTSWPWLRRASAGQISR